MLLLSLALLLLSLALLLLPLLLPLLLLLLLLLLSLPLLLLLLPSRPSAASTSAGSEARVSAQASGLRLAAPAASLTRRRAASSRA